ncbi:MAG: DUF1700 domain-containing protein [Clostridia bacterium]|nr:DUF1700 domain-containing protein [Clostridia bacterium]
MSKEEFLTRLRSALAGLPQNEVNERIAFYGEMIDDRMEKGVSENDAVAAIGSVEEIASQIIAEIPITKIVKEKIKPNRSLHTWEIILIILSFPLWFPLLVAAFAVLLSLYIVVWSLIISLWAVEISLWAAALACIAVSPVGFIHGNIFFGLMLLGCGLFIAGISIFLFFGCVAASKGTVKLTKKIAVGIKSMFIKKES